MSKISDNGIERIQSNILRIIYDNDYIYNDIIFL